MKTLKQLFILLLASPSEALPILYHREKKAKSVGFKIGDLGSKFGFYIRGLFNV